MELSEKAVVSDVAKRGIGGGPCQSLFWWWVNCNETCECLKAMHLTWWYQVLPWWQRIIGKEEVRVHIPGAEQGMLAAILVYYISLPMHRNCKFRLVWVYVLSHEYVTCCGHEFFCSATVKLNVGWLLINAWHLKCSIKQGLMWCWTENVFVYMWYTISEEVEFIRYEFTLVPYGELLFWL